MIQGTVRFTDGSLTLIGEPHDNDMTHWEKQCNLCDERSADVVALEKDFELMNNPFECNPIDIGNINTGIALYGIHNDSCTVAGFDDRSPLVSYMQQQGYDGNRFPDQRTLIKYITDDDFRTMWKTSPDKIASSELVGAIANQSVARCQLDIYQALYNKREQAMLRNLLSLVRGGNTVVASVGACHFPVLIEALTAVSDIEPTLKFTYPTGNTTVADAQEWCAKQERHSATGAAPVSAD